MSTFQADAETVIRKPFGRVLFATDFSKMSERFLVEAARFASNYGYRLHVINVVVRSGKRAGPAGDDWDHAPVKNRSDMELLHHSVKQIVPGVVTRVWRDTSTAGGILSYAKREGISLIVMGPGSRSRLWEAWRGSITQVIARTSPTSVLIPFSRVGNRRGILAAVDFSDQSRKALVHASHLAIRHKQKLTVLHVPERKNVNAEDDLRGFVARAKLQCEAVHIVGRGDTAKAIVEAATKIRAELVVLGASATTRRPGVWVDGTVAQVLRKADRPVLIYRPSTSD